MTVLHRNRAIRNLERIRDFEGASVRVRLEALRAVEHAATVMAAVLAQKLAVALERRT